MEPPPPLPDSPACKFFEPRRHADGSWGIYCTIDEKVSTPDFSKRKTVDNKAMNKQCWNMMQRSHGNAVLYAHLFKYGPQNAIDYVVKNGWHRPNAVQNSIATDPIVKQNLAVAESNAVQNSAKQIKKAVTETLREAGPVSREMVEGEEAVELVEEIENSRMDVDAPPSRKRGGEVVADRMAELESELAKMALEKDRMALEKERMARRIQTLEAPPRELPPGARPSSIRMPTWDELFADPETFRRFMLYLPGMDSYIAQKPTMLRIENSPVDVALYDRSRPTLEGQRLKAKGKLAFLGPECYHPMRNAAGEPRYKKSVCAVFEHPETGAEVELVVEDDACTAEARPAWIEVKAEWVELYDRYVREGVDTPWDVFE